MLQQFFGNLDSIEGGAFSQLVAGDPDIDAVVFGYRLVLADSAYIDVIFAGGVDWHREAIVLAVVYQRYAGRGAQEVPDLVRGDGVGKFKIDTFTVRPEDGDANAGAGNRDIRTVENLPGFFDHFYLFEVVAVGIELRIMAEDVKRYLVREGAAGRVFAVENFASLVFEFEHCRHTCPAGGLVSADYHSFDRVCLV